MPAGRGVASSRRGRASGRAPQLGALVERLLDARASRSMPSTRQPFARRSCTASWPIRPSPITAADLAERRRRDAQALERDRAERREGGLVERQRRPARARPGSRAPRPTRRGSRSPRRRTRRGRPARSRATPSPDRLDDARARVAERLRHVEAVHHRAVGRQRPLLAQLAQPPGARGPAGCAPCRAATCARSPSPSSRCPGDTTEKWLRTSTWPGRQRGRRHLDAARACRSSGSGRSASSRALRSTWPRQPGCGSNGRARSAIVGERALARPRSRRPRRRVTSSGSRTARDAQPSRAIASRIFGMRALVEAHQAHARRGRARPDRWRRARRRAARRAARAAPRPRPRRRRRAA